MVVEYLGFALDIGAYFLFSHLEARMKDNLADVRDVTLPTFHSFAEAKTALRDTPNAQFQYARIEGNLLSSGQPVHTCKADVKAIVKVQETFLASRVRSTDDPTVWDDLTGDRLDEIVDRVPCCIAFRKDASYAKEDKLLKLKQFNKVARVTQVDAIDNSLADEAVPFTNRFRPKQECVTQFELAQLQVREGKRTTERLIRVGTPVTAIGKVSWNESRNELTVGCPDFPGQRYVLTTDVDNVVSEWEVEAHAFNVARRIAIVAGVFLLYLAYDRLYKDFKEWKNRKRRCGWEDN